MQTLRSSGRHYVVTGANSKTGEDVQITVEAFDEADAARTANRQGVFVSRCVPAGADGNSWAGGQAGAETSRASASATATAPAPAMTFAETVARDPVVRRLVAAHPQLGPRVKRLNAEDKELLADLVGEPLGVSYRDSAHVGRLMKAEKTPDENGTAGANGR